ncbi:hypothetical protein, partial [Bacillus spizizenii]
SIMERIKHAEKEENASEHQDADKKK